MKRLLACIVATAAVLSLAIAGCTQAAPVATPTKAPATAVKAVEPTKAPAAAVSTVEPTKAPPVQPTAVPAKKSDYPQQGKVLTLVGPYSAGGSTDIHMRLLAPLLEKELGIPVQVVNKPGAAGQVAATEIALQTKPDGYTALMMAFPSGVAVYVDPERKAAFSRKELQPVAADLAAPFIAVVKPESPYKTVKDLVDDGKANPEKVKIGITGVLAAPHLGILQTEKLTGAKFAPVHFDGGAPAQTALLGGHVDVQFCDAPQAVPQLKSGQLRLLGVMDKQPYKLFPEARTFESQGYPVYFTNYEGMVVPAGTPQDIVGVLAGALKKVMTTDEYQKKLVDMGVEGRYMDTPQFAAFWADQESMIKELVEAYRKK